MYIAQSARNPKSPWVAENLQEMVAYLWPMEGPFRMAERDTGDNAEGPTPAQKATWREVVPVFQLKAPIFFYNCLAPIESVATWLAGGVLGNGNGQTFFFFPFFLLRPGPGVSFFGWTGRATRNYLRYYLYLYISVLRTKCKVSTEVRIDRPRYLTLLVCLASMMTGELPRCPSDQRNRYSVDNEKEREKGREREKDQRTWKSAQRSYSRIHGVAQVQTPVATPPIQHWSGLPTPVP